MAKTPRLGSRQLQIESLEPRLCMATSVGWDGPGQGNAELTYYIANTPAGLDAAAVEDAIEEALAVWAAEADIVFTETSLPGQRDSIDFTFRSIDGAGGTLAQAYFPDDVNPARIAGDVQFDTAERWEVGNSLDSAAYDLVLVAVHEIGHALGLDHSRAAGSVMAASVSANQVFDGLASADVDAILSLYAAADEAAPPGDDPDATDVPGTDPDLANVPTIWFVPRWRGRWFWFVGFSPRSFGATSRGQFDTLEAASEGQAPGTRTDPVETQPGSNGTLSVDAFFSHVGTRPWHQWHHTWA